MLHRIKQNIKEVYELEEDTRDNQTNGWDEKKKNNKCIINIFCGDKKPDCMEDDKKNTGNCTINIFCNEIKHESMSDCKKNNAPCIINIFCNDKKSDCKCNGEKDW